MEMPAPGPGHAHLARLIGTWEGEERMAATPWGPAATATGRYVMRAGMGGFFVLQDYEQHRGERRSYEGHGVFGWDPKRDVYTWYWVDSFGGTPNPSEGTMTADGWVFDSRSDHGKARYTYRFLAPDRIAFSIEQDTGHGWAEFMRGEYRRLGG